MGSAAGMIQKLFRCDLQNAFAFLCFHPANPRLYPFVGPLHLTSRAFLTSCGNFIAARPGTRNKAPGRTEKQKQRTTQNPMNSMLKILLITAIAVALDSQAAQRGRPLGVTVGRPDAAPEAAAHPKGPGGEAAAGHLAVVYGSVRPFDTDANGKLSATETEAVAKAILEGKLKPEHPRGPGANDAKNLTAERAGKIASRIAAAYAAVAPFDANKDGKLDEAEQAAVTKALADGSLDLPHHGPGGPRHNDGTDVGADREATHKKILETYDTNKDGKLDETERAALMADVKAGKIELPGRPGGHRGGPGR